MPKHSYFDLRSATLFHCQKQKQGPLPKHMLEVKPEETGVLRRSNAVMGPDSIKKYFSLTRNNVTCGTPDLRHATNKDLIEIEKEIEEVDTSASTPSVR